MENRLSIWCSNKFYFNIPCSIWWSFKSQLLKWGKEEINIENKTYLEASSCQHKIYYRKVFLLKLTGNISTLVIQRIQPPLTPTSHTKPGLHKKEFSIKDFFSKCDQIHKKLRIWSHLLKKSLTLFRMGGGGKNI